MEFTNTRFGKCVLTDITQGQFEKFSDAMNGVENLSLPIWNGKAVRAARDAGFFIEPVLTDEQVSEAKPGLIRWLAGCIAEVVNEANRIDPLS